MRGGTRYEPTSVLALARRGMGWRQARLAEAIRLSIGSVSHHETRMTSLPENKLRLALKALRIPARSATGEAILSESRERAKAAKKRAAGAR